MNKRLVAAAAALLFVLVLPEMSSATALQVTIRGPLDSPGLPAAQLRFDIDTSDVTGNFPTGTCGKGIEYSPVVSGVYSGFNVTGGIRNASISVEGFGSDSQLQSGHIFYYQDFGLCKFYVGMNLQFASGLSFFSQDQYLTTPYYSYATTTPDELLADVLTEGYNNRRLSAASFWFDGAMLGHPMGYASVVPEPGTLALLGLGLAGLGFTRRRKTNLAER